VNTDEILRVVEAARHLTHPMRSMRVTMECGHLRLLPWNVTLTGIGSHTGCNICGDNVERLVVNVEETGTLDKTFFASPSSTHTSDGSPESTESTVENTR
jgi:hypothetical protein